MPSSHSRAGMLVLLVALLLTACGQSTPEPAPTVEPTPTSVAEATRPAAPTPTTAPTVQAAIAQPTQTAPEPKATTPVALYKGIRHGVTPEGYFYLGSPDAPVTLTDYSDFL